MEGKHVNFFLFFVQKKKDIFFISFFVLFLFVDSPPPPSPSHFPNRSEGLALHVCLNCLDYVSWD